MGNSGFGKFRIGNSGFKTLIYRNFREIIVFQISIRNENSDKNKNRILRSIPVFGGRNEQLTILILNYREIVAFQILVRNGKFRIGNSGFLKL